MNLQANDLSCKRGRRILFEQLSFTLRPGQTLILRGENGSGKSSLLRILAGLALPTAGTVNWGDEDISEREAEYHAAMLFIGHLSGFKADLSAIENLDFFATLSGGKRLSTASEALTRLGLRKDIAHLPCRQLSAGQRKRVALARLVQTQAILWLLDEPLTALDVSTCEAVGHLMRAHLETGGMLVTATHADIQLGQMPITTLTLGA